MNTKITRLLPATLAIAGIATTGAFMTQDASAAEAWGPQNRQTFTWNSPATYATFNSMTDNPSLGHESNFVRIREAGTSNTYKDDVTIEVGKEYEVFVYYHNNGAANYGAQVMADNVRLKANFPTKLTAGQNGEVRGTITATNTNPLEVWDTAYMKATTTVYLSYVPNSAVLHNGSTGQYSTNGSVLDSESLFGDGAKLAYDSRAWGFIPGCNEYAGYVTYRIKVDQPGWFTTKTVSAEGKNDYKETMTANPGDVLDFKIEYANTGTTWQTAVTVHDQMPNGLEYVKDSTYVSNSKGNNQKVSDALFEEKGLNIGDHNAGQKATITYKGRLTGDDKVFACGETTIYNNAWLVTENGTQYDKVKITVKRTCEGTPTCEDGYTLVDGVCVSDDKFPDDKPEPTPSEYTPETPSQLPHTGPTEIALAAMIIVLLIIGGTYWFVSWTKLNKTSAAVKGAGKAQKATGDNEVVKDSIVNK